MDSYKTLYKDLRSHTPRKHNKINRELLEANRFKRRRQIYEDSRNISPSPTPSSPIQGIEEIQPASEENSIEISNTTKCDKLTKQEAFIKRFVEWKKSKNIKKQTVVKPKPFVSAVNSGSTFVPRGHPEGFRPPVALKNVANKEKVEEKKIEEKKRQSTYILIPTPPKKQIDEKKITPVRRALYAKTPSDEKKIGRTATKTKSNIKTPQSKKSVTRKSPRNLEAKNSEPLKDFKMPPLPPSNLRTTAFPNKPTGAIAKARHLAKKRAEVVKETKKLSSQIGGASLAQKLKRETQTRKDYAALNRLEEIVNIKKPKFKKPVIKKSLAVSEIISANLAFGKGKTVATKSSSQPLCDFKMPPPQPSKISSTAAPSMPTGAIPKARCVAKQTKKSSSKLGGACLAQNFKAKKPINTIIICPETIQLACKEIQTPKDFATLNPFEEFVTSTKLKGASHIVENVGVDVYHPKEASQKKSHCNSSAKRNILISSTNAALITDSGQNSEKCDEGNVLQSVVKKHNFIRYSEAADLLVNDNNNKDEEIEAKENKIKPSSDGGDDHTPIKPAVEEKPANYMSPFVSVSRGKVSIKREKENRNSVYLQNTISESNDLPKENVRTLEAVRYFRKQLQDEIDRLHQLCDTWEAYKNDNLEKIQCANGEDMINVTVGQTRLLTSKKFMQFKGLIDRCEAGVTGNGAVEYDGSEDTKPITSGDLEGFWCMLGIQIDNLEKRFDSLNRWKMNDWMDPDEEQPKIKKKLTKVKKPKAIPTAKAKPNSALQDMLRKMQAEMRKNKNKNNDLNEIVVFTSSKIDQRRSGSFSKSINTSSSRRLSIVVKDRKYFSPAATVLSFSSPNRKTSKYLEDSPSLIKHLQSPLELRKSILINENSRRMSLKTKSPVINNKNKENEIICEERGVTTPVQTGRKSILKTPGTAKSKLRNVIFNERLRVKKFNFLINETGDQFNGESSEETQEDLFKSCEEVQSNDIPLRTLTLRNRKVHLRPSSEIVIPKN